MEIVKQVFGAVEVRAVAREGEAWFVLNDVCQALGIANPRNAAARLDEDEKGVHTVDTLGGRQEVTVVGESGVYGLIFQSRKAEAKAFRRWVTHEVLPTLRRTGFYSTRQPVITAAGIARAYSRPASSIPVWLQEYGLNPVGYAENPDTGKPVHVYDMAEVEQAFSEGHRYGFTGLRAYTGAWTEGKIPPELMPLSLKEKNRRFREAREAEEVKRLDALHGRTG